MVSRDVFSGSFTDTSSKLLLTQNEELGDYLDKDAELAGSINIIRLLNGMHVNILSFLTKNLGKDKE
jgi:hypothetical protein